MCTYFTLDSLGSKGCIIGGTLGAICAMGMPTTKEVDHAKATTTAHMS